MAHNLDFSLGAAAMFYTGKEAPWHRLGVSIAEAPTSAEAIRLARLAWLVEKFPLSARVNGNLIPVNGKYATIRTDTNGVLGVVGDDYKPFQNEEAFDFMDTIVGEGLARYETAGALNCGRRVWMLARMPGEVRAAGDDVINPYVLLTNSHDGTTSLRMFPTTVRVVCQNTLNLSLRKAGTAGVSIRHCESLSGRVEDARRNLGIIGKRVEEYGEEVKALVSRKLAGTEARDYFETIYPTKAPKKAAPVVNDNAGLLSAILDGRAGTNELMADLLAGHQEEQSRAHARNKKILDSILDNYENRKNNLPGIKGTAWAAYNAVSEFLDHQKTVRGRSQADRDNNRLNSIWFGSANETKQTAYANALALASN